MVVSNEHWFILKGNKCIAYTDDIGTFKCYIKTKIKLYEDNPEKLKEFQVRYYTYDLLPPEFKEFVDKYETKYNPLEIVIDAYGSEPFAITSDDESVLLDYADNYMCSLANGVRDLKKYVKYLKLGKYTSKLVDDTLKVLDDYVNFIAEDENENGIEDVCVYIDPWGLYKVLVKKGLLS